MSITVVGTIREVPRVVESIESNGGLIVYFVMDCTSGLPFSAKVTATSAGQARRLRRGLRPHSVVTVRCAGLVSLVSQGEAVLRLQDVSYIGSPSISLL